MSEIKHAFTEFVCGIVYRASYIHGFIDGFWETVIENIKTYEKSRGV